MSHCRSCSLLWAATARPHPRFVLLPLWHLRTGCVQWAYILGVWAMFPVTVDKVVGTRGGKSASLTRYGIPEMPRRMMESRNAFSVQCGRAASTVSAHISTAAADFTLFQRRDSHGAFHECVQCPAEEASVCACSQFPLPVGPQAVFSKPCVSVIVSRV